MTEVKKDETTNSHGGMLSSSDFLRLVILDEVEKAKKDFWNRDFKKHGRKFIIHPFSPTELTPFSYDLAVGEQVYSCNRRTVEKLEELNEKTYWMAPGETLVIKTKEFVALPPCYSATVWPRFKMPVEGIFQSMVKIDPTWYGELVVAVTNLSGGDFPIKHGETFATLILYRLTNDTGMHLYRKENLSDPEEFELCEGLDKEVQTIKEKLKEAHLESICEVVDTKMRLKQLPDSDSYKRLLNVHTSSAWRNMVIECVGHHPKEMQGLGLNTLEIIRPTPPKVRKLTKEDIQTTKCSETELENTAIEYGKPFNLLASVPEWMLQKVEKDIVPRIEAEVGARLFPQIVQLTLRILALLSLIGVAIALAAKYFDVQKTWLGVVSVSAIPLMLIFLIFIFGKFPRQKEKKLKKGREQEERRLEERRKEIEQKEKEFKKIEDIIDKKFREWENKLVEKIKDF